MAPEVDYHAPNAHVDEELVVEPETEPEDPPDLTRGQKAAETRRRNKELAEGLEKERREKEVVRGSRVRTAKRDLDGNVVQLPKVGSRKQVQVEQEPVINKRKAKSTASGSKKRSKK